MLTAGAGEEVVPPEELLVVVVPEVVVPETVIVVVVMVEPPALSHARMVSVCAPALRVSEPLSVLLVDVNDVAAPLS